MNKKSLAGIFCILFFLASFSLRAQRSYELYAGDDILLAAPSPPRGALYQTAWAGKHASLQVSKSGMYGARVKVTSYFSGPAQVQCDYYWYYYINDRQYTNRATTFYTIYCCQVDVMLDKSSISLKEGTGEYLNYILLPSNPPLKPIVRWSSNNPNVATVDSNGYVYAKSAGVAIITVKTDNDTSATCTVEVVETTPVTPPTPPTPPPSGGDEGDDDGGDGGDDDDGDEEDEEDDEDDDQDVSASYIDQFIKVAKKRLNSLKIKWLDYL